MGIPSGSTTKKADQQTRAAPTIQPRRLHDPGSASVRGMQLCQVISLGQVVTEEPQEHPSVAATLTRLTGTITAAYSLKPMLEVVRRDDVHQVRDHQRQACGVGDETGTHDERQGCRRGESAGPAACEITIGVRISAAPSLANSADTSAPSSTMIGKQLAAAAPSPAATCSAAQAKQPGFVEQQADDDQRDRRCRWHSRPCARPPGCRRG